MTREEAKALRLDEFVLSLVGELPTWTGDLQNLQDITLGLDVATISVAGYSYMPERLELWSEGEPYYNEILNTNVGLARTWPTYAYFTKDPFTGDNVNLYSTIDAWIFEYPWDSKEYVRGEDLCEEAYYERGFLRAPIPVIPYMVDTFTPQVPFPDIPEPPPVSVVAGTFPCISVVKTIVDGEIIYTVDIDHEGINMTGTGPCLFKIVLDFLLNRGTLTLGTTNYVLGRTGNTVGWIKLSEC